MTELDLQGKYVIHFLCERTDGLHYKEVKANTVSAQFFIEQDVLHFISQTTLNQENYRKLLRKFGSEASLMKALMLFLDEKVKASANMAIFINNHKSITFEGYKLHLFYPSGSEAHEDELFEENIFSVVQELPYTFWHEGKTHFNFRADLSFFVNGFFLCYSELKSIYNGQNARKNGRAKVYKDFSIAIENYLKIADQNDISKTIRKDFLKVFEKSIYVTATDANETYVIRNLSAHFDAIKNNEEKVEEKFLQHFSKYPILDTSAKSSEQFETTFRLLYDKKMIEKEILYYNFIERELIKKEDGSGKEYKHSDGRLISPRPKQKFGTDKVLAKISEFLEHENEPDYFIQKLRAQLVAQGVGTLQIEELITKRQKYQNNKNTYSLLLQYAAGFGKSNIIGWCALQLKDLRKDGVYVYDKIMIVVDRLQLRDQLDSKMHNMNIQKSMFVEADSQKTFKEALESDRRIIVVNLQKFDSVKNILDSASVQKLHGLRTVFLIDEIHRSNSGVQHEEMLSIFDELQGSFDQKEGSSTQNKKKNLIIGFTATPSDHTLARFGEFNRYAESERLWIPFDYYTMREAIEDGYILNPLTGVVPVSAKMYFDLKDNDLEGFEDDLGYEHIPDDTDTGYGINGKKYSIRKRKIYENEERIKAIAQFISERLVLNVYHKIYGYAKAMLAVTSIKAAIKYKTAIEASYKILVAQKHERFKDAPIYIIYSDSQEYKSCSSMNGGLSEETVLQNFANKKNGLIIVVDKLQTGFDEPRLHTLFLDKEIRGINAIQTISRVNRTTKYKNDCKIIDFSYKNVNVSNIKKAFEHFSNVVVSDFDPLGDETKMSMLHDDLKQHSLYETQFTLFEEFQKDDVVQKIIIVNDNFGQYIKQNEKVAKQLKSKINAYFRILNLIEFVIDIEPKLKEENFLDFWRTFNKCFNSVNRGEEIIDDVEIYFDNKIGIVNPLDKKEKEQKKKDVKSTANGSDSKYKYNILKVIEKRNQEEDAIEALIKDFELKIEQFFAYIRSDEMGARVVAKLKDSNSAFDTEEIQEDFTRIYRKFIRRNKDLGDLFERETKDNLPQLCDDFERSLHSKIAYLRPMDHDEMSIAAEPE
jgi:type I restriction enzyme, R subunit